MQFVEALCEFFKMIFVRERGGAIGNKEKKEKKNEKKKERKREEKERKQREWQPKGEEEEGEENKKSWRISPIVSFNLLF